MGANLRDWALECTRWMLAGHDESHNLREADEVANWENIFYKQRRVKDDGFSCTSPRSKMNPPA